MRPTRGNLATDLFEKGKICKRDMSKPIYVNANNLRTHINKHNVIKCLQYLSNKTGKKG
jgi:hypothetical protein